VSIDPNPSAYLRAVEKVLQRFSSRRQTSPATLLTDWTRFVDSATAGYPSGWYEFDNERRVRDVIEAVLSDDAVRSFPEAADWQREVSHIDERYRALLVPFSAGSGDASWWKAGVPRYAGPELADDLRRMYQKEIEVRN
jgi:hypothetical protein